MTNKLKDVSSATWPTPKSLSLDFPARRSFIKSLDRSERVLKVFEHYPLFKDRKQIIAEAKKVMGSQEINFLEANKHAAQGKRRYDSKVKSTSIQIGDRVLVRNLTYHINNHQSTESMLPQ